MSAPRKAKGAGRRLSFEAVFSAMNSIGTAWVFVILVLVNADVVGRTLFNTPIRGVTEIVSLSIVACVFMQLAHTIKVGRMTRSEVFLDWVGRRRARVRQFLEGVYFLVGAALMGVLFTSSLPLFVEAWQIDEYVGAQGDFTAPVWPVKLVIIIGCAAAGVQFLRGAARHFRSAAASGPPAGSRPGGGA
jgi:TRAP-type mannitol/chloroaromatic compound transport system permease small subunit